MQPILYRCRKRGSVAVLFRISLVIGLLAGGLFARNAVTAPAESMKRGELAFERGAFADAAEEWRQAQEGYKKVGDSHGEVHAVLREVAACSALGKVRLATTSLQRANAIANRLKDSAGLRAEIRAAQGSILTFGNKLADPESILQDALLMARNEDDQVLEAKVLNDLGILFASKGEADRASKLFRDSKAVARHSDLPILAAKVQRNLAGALVSLQDFPSAIAAARVAVLEAKTLAPSHDRAFLILGCSQLLQEIALALPEELNAMRAEAFGLLKEAQGSAEKIGDKTALSYSLGYQGAMYEFERRPSEGLTLTRQAIAYAQSANAPEALYRWQWQAGRMLRTLGERQAAIDSYRRAVETLQPIRDDLSARYGNRNDGSSFRELTGGVYFELADLLLQQADESKDPNEVQTLLRRALDTTEQLKVAEFSDYFQDDCANLLRAKTKKIEAISPSAAVIYLIPLSNRIEIIVSLPSGVLKRFKTAVTAEQLTDVTRRFRINLEDRTNEGYLQQAQQLYGWLVSPIESLVRSSSIETLVFIPDAALRNIPMAALHDGTGFLVERFAVAVTPGLTLMESGSGSRERTRLLVCGLSKAVNGFPPLPFVPREISSIKTLYENGESLLDQKFLKKSVKEKLTADTFTIVHLASHGQFSRDVRQSFVLTYDERLTIDDLEAFIRPGQLRERPLDLLTLSACQTAAGDDRAALGLAGIAVKAGARSALATLWCVNDEASAKLVETFYSHLSSEPATSKAHALQAAQREILSNPLYEHPCYWAPFLIIGNWL